MTTRCHTEDIATRPLTSGQPVRAADHAHCGLTTV